MRRALIDNALNRGDGKAGMIPTELVGVPSVGKIERATLTLQQVEDGWKTVEDLIREDAEPGAWPDAGSIEIEFTEKGTKIVWVGGTSLEE